MERAARNAGEIVAADRHMIQHSLCGFRTAFVQFCTIGHSVLAVSKQVEGIALTAAGVQQIDRFAFRKPERGFEPTDMRYLSGIVPEADVVHQPADHSGTYRLCFGVRQQRRHTL